MGQEPAWSLGTHLDVVRIGLPKEYAFAVAEGALVAGGKFPPGVLSFICALHGEVGSSPALFRRMAKHVVDLLGNRRDSSESELLRILEL